MSTDTAKEELLGHFARIGKAVASPPRLKLLELLSQGEKPVETLADQAGLSVTNTSNHLRGLRQASLVLSRREGQQIFYRLASPSVRRLLASLKDVAHEQLAEVRELVREYLDDREGLEPLDASGLHQRMKEKEVVVLDVRPGDEYAQGHVPGAVSIPLDQLARRLEELPRDREIVAYCRGPYCLMAAEAARTLRSRSLRVRRMEDGMPEWEALGLPVATSRGT